MKENRDPADTDRRYEREMGLQRYLQVSCHILGCRSGHTEVFLNEGPSKAIAIVVVQIQDAIKDGRIH